MTARPRVAFVGGVQRLERALISLGDALGVDVEVHHGDTRGHAIERLSALVHRTDTVILVTGVSSHGAVLLAKREAAVSGAHVRIVKFCGLAKARALLSEIADANAA